MDLNQLDYDYEVDLINTTTNLSSASSESWSAYSISYILETCPEPTVDESRYLLANVTPIYSKADEIYLKVILPSFLCIGIIGNLLFIYVVCSMSTMRTATNWCLANLAVADLIFLVFGIGEKLWMFYHSPFVGDRLSFGRHGCPIVFAFIDSSYFAALCMVTLVSMERYYAVCRTHSARTNTRKSMFIALVLISWIVSIGIASTFIPASGFNYVGCRVWPDVEPYNHLPMYRGGCAAWEGYENFAPYVNIARTIPFFMLITFNLWMYVCIVKSMTRAVRETRIAGREDTNLKQRNQIAAMLMINGLIFFICLVPFEIFCVLQAVNLIGPERELIIPMYIVTPLRYVSQVMSYINNIVNPFVYIGLSKRYRDAFKNAIMCRRRVDYTSRIKTRTRSSTTTSTALSVHKSVNIKGNM